MRGSGAMPLPLGSGALLITGIALACWSPTEIELDVSTDVGCGEDVQTAIFVDGTAGSIGNAYGCADAGAGGNPIGKFVVAPAGSRDAHVSVEVALLRGRAHDVQDCRTNDSLPDCIVARRAFAFETHRSQYVDIRLYEQCFGHHCPADQTCAPDANGAPSCVPALVAPDDEPCIGCTSSADPPFSDLDAAADVTVDAPVDASTLACPLAAGPLATAAQPSGRIVANATHLIWKTPGFTGLQTLAKQGGAVQSFAIGALATNITLYAMSPDGQHLVAANATDRMYVLDTSTPPPWVTKQLLNFPPAPTGISSVAINDSGEIFAGAAADGGPTTSVFYNQDGIGTMWKPLAKPTMASIEVVASSRSGTVFSTDLVTTFFDDVGAGKGSQLTFAPLELAAAETGVAYATASEVGTLDEAPSNKTLTLATNPRDLVLRPNRLHFVSDVGSGQAIQTVTQGTAPVTHVTDTGIVGLAVDNGCFFYWSGGSVRVAGP